MIRSKSTHTHTQRSNSSQNTPILQIALMGLITASLFYPAFATEITLYENVSTESDLPVYGEPPRNAGVMDLDGDSFRDLVFLFDGLISSSHRLNSINTSNQAIFESTPSTPWSPTSPQMNTSGMITADVNNDGHLDVYFPNYGDGVYGHRLYLYNPSSGSFDDVTATYLPDTSIDRTVSASWGDYDGDSFVDLLIVRSTSVQTPSPAGIKLLRNIGGTGFSEVSTGIDDNLPKVISAIWADFDQDNDVELVLVQSYPDIEYRTRYYENQIHGHDVSQMLSQPTKINNCLGHFSHQSNCAVSADFNNDGLLDLAYHHRSGLGIVTSDAQGTFSDFSIHNNYFGVPDDSQGPHIQDITAFDADHDGFQDIFCSLRKDQPSYYPTLYFGDPSGGGISSNKQTFTSQIGGDPGVNNANGVCVADLTNDGLKEILIPRNYSYQNHGSFFWDIPNISSNGYQETNWVGFTLEALEGLCNRSCIGATVIVESHDPADNFKQAQLVDGGSGRGSQNDLMLSFGLGSYTGLVDVKVIYPNRGVIPGGTVYQWDSLAIKQYHHLQVQLGALDVQDDDIETSFVHEASTGRVGMYVTWNTDFDADWSRDKIVFFDDEADALVGDHMEYVGSTDPQVSSGPYPHTMFVENLPCDTSKKYYFQILTQAKEGGMVLKSNILEAQTTKCLVPKELPIDPNTP